MNRLIIAALAAILMSIGFGASAATIKVETVYLDAGNDCAGKFGRPFDSCVDPDGSPVIAKTDGNGAVTEINSNFSDVLANMFTVTFDDASKSSGTWTYNPCGTCVNVTSWVAKAGNGFLWFHTVPKEAVFSGTWYTPDGKELSHLTFYDSAPVPIPVPAAGLMLLAGLGGIAAFRRRRR